jgi:hypothetical protein
MLFLEAHWALEGAVIYFVAGWANGCRLHGWHSKMRTTNEVYTGGTLNVSVSISTKKANEKVSLSIRLVNICTRGGRGVRFGAEDADLGIRFVGHWSSDRHGIYPELSKQTSRLRGCVQTTTVHETQFRITRRM